ncbi:hypothetical protein OAF56_04495 [Pirellulaceae bacterium]|nr:hypothetical protein [Pirellulaceae bacterium]
MLQLDLPCQSWLPKLVAKVGCQSWLRGARPCCLAKSDNRFVTRDSGIKYFRNGVAIPNRVDASVKLSTTNTSVWQSTSGVF